MIETSTLLQSARELLAPWATEFTEPEQNRLDAYLPTEKIVEVVRAITANPLWHLSAITGMDVPQAESRDGRIELLYHFCQQDAVVTLRIFVEYGMPMAPSICPVIPSAALYEREAVEMFGVILDGSPMRERLLLPDDWPDGVYPLRKSFKGLEEG